MNKIYTNVLYILCRRKKNFLRRTVSLGGSILHKGKNFGYSVFIGGKNLLFGKKAKDATVKFPLKKDEKDDLLNKISKIIKYKRSFSIDFQKKDRGKTKEIIKSLNIKRDGKFLFWNNKNALNIIQSFVPLGPNEIIRSKMLEIKFLMNSKAENIEESVRNLVIESFKKIGCFFRVKEKDDVLNDFFLSIEEKEMNKFEEIQKIIIRWNMDSTKFTGDYFIEILERRQIAKQKIALVSFIEHAKSMGLNIVGI